jgi:hypothetical protein
VAPVTRALIDGAWLAVTPAVSGLPAVFLDGA